MVVKSIKMVNKLANIICTYRDTEMCRNMYLKNTDHNSFLRSSFREMVREKLARKTITGQIQLNARYDWNPCSKTVKYITDDLSGAILCSSYTMLPREFKAI